ncbi:MAG: phage tail protein [Ideonella sp.]|nr:phage tail protein [Ideonella sp.]MCC7455994.1 phage tail protein [Nitrospira sp.]
MADFVWVESPGATMELQAAVVATQFGDGYEQRADAGLNPVRQVWDVPFTAIDTEVADEIEAFVRPGLGRVLFDWVPPGQSTALKFKCTSFKRSLTDRVGLVDVAVRFEQRFEP